MKEYMKVRSLPTIAALLVLAVFAVGILSVLLGGAAAYQRLNQRDQAAFESRTCVQYLATKVRQASGPDAVSIAPFGQTDALVIRQDLEGEVYLTRIYCHDGWMMELYGFEDGQYAPEDGEKILPLSGLEMDMQQDLLSISVAAADGSRQQLVLAVRGKGEVQP